MALSNWTLSALSSSGEAAPPQEVVSVQTFGDFFAAGGPVMIPIILCSVAVLGFALERYLNLRQGKVLPHSVREAVELLLSGKTKAAVELVEGSTAPAARILAAGIRRQGYPVADVEKAMEDQALKEGEKLRGNIRPLNLLANIAPLLGLLGTVIGIADAFHAVVKTGMGKPENLAAGIEEALTTTIAGLTVAIPALLLAAHLTSRARLLITRADEALTPAVEALAAKPQTGSGHAA